MGWAANKRKARKCLDCQQTLHGISADIREHAATCARLTRLNLVVPGLVVGQDAVDVLSHARKHKSLRPSMGGRPK